MPLASLSLESRIVTLFFHLLLTNNERIPEEKSQIRKKLHHSVGRRDSSLSIGYETETQASYGI
jgi:hypothetical protein